VATSVGALREVVVDGQTGLLVDIRDPRSLEEALVSVLGDPELAARLGANAAPAALALAVTPSEWAHSLEQLVETAQRKRNGALTNLNARRTWLSHFPR
jgi:glycosyltransferase involved in cell wall biosynthesis